MNREGVHLKFSIVNKINHVSSKTPTIMANIII